MAGPIYQRRRSLHRTLDGSRSKLPDDPCERAAIVGGTPETSARTPRVASSITGSATSASSSHCGHRIPMAASAAPSAARPHQSSPSPPGDCAAMHHSATAIGQRRRKILTAPIDAGPRRISRFRARRGVSQGLGDSADPHIAPLRASDGQSGSRAGCVPVMTLVDCGKTLGGWRRPASVAARSRPRIAGRRLRRVTSGLAVFHGRLSVVRPGAARRSRVWICWCAATSSASAGLRIRSQAQTHVHRPISHP